MGVSSGRKPPGGRFQMALLGGPCLVLAAALAALSAVVPVEAGPYDYSQTQLTSASDYPDYQTGVRYDEYPVVVPKRAALLIDKLMVALQKALDEPGEKGGIRVGIAHEKSANDNEKKDLQRREQQKGRVYWRCYFNAVSCFKRK